MGLVLSPRASGEDHFHLLASVLFMRFGLTSTIGKCDYECTPHCPSMCLVNHRGHTCLEFLTVIILVAKLH